VYANVDKETLEQFQILIEMMGKMATKEDVANIQAGLDENKHEILKTQVKIEHEVSNKISSLFDGHKLAHEKQFELERKMEALERRLLALEDKIA
jgi:polyhydroxyalkanoate synthesis regulator phasin